MQSHLETVLSAQENNTAPDEYEKDEPDEEIEETDEFIDESLRSNECDGESPHKPVKSGGGGGGGGSSGKVVTLQTLLDDGLLQAGKGVLAIEYLGQKFTGDLLEDGKIQSQETDLIFASPSAWAFACKRIINPIKKSGCGWSSVKYNGRKLDVYKNLFLKKKKDFEDRLKEAEEADNMADVAQATNPYIHQMIVKHNTIANRTFTHDANTMIECVPFSNIGKIQPFLISLSTNAALLMDFHCHLTKSEVSGYLAGSWDVNAHNLHITRTFPCRNTKLDRDKAAQVEAHISKTIDAERLTLVGWYHSHPLRAAAPTLRDVDAQLDYQIRMKGSSDNSYTPCIGLIISPYNFENQSLESIITAYWVIPPPENKPNEYGRPMAMSFSVSHDPTLSTHLKDEMKMCVDYYQKEHDFVQFGENYIQNTTYIDKLKTSLISKFPREESETSLWSYVRALLGFKPMEEEPVLSIPNVSKSSQLLPPVTISPNMMLTSDIANALFSSGKFPSATSLLGLPDPMAHSTLAANNMFLSTNLFKMQELLRPLSSSSPMSSTSTSTSSTSKTLVDTSTLKIPNETKVTICTSPAIPSTSGLDFTKIPKIDYTTDKMPNYCADKLSKIDYNADMNLIASLKSKFDYSIPQPSTSASIVPELEAVITKSFSAADLSISSVKPLSQVIDFSLDLSKKLVDGEKPAKLPKMEYVGLDMSTSKVEAAVEEGAMNLSSEPSKEVFNVNPTEVQLGPTDLATTS